MNEKYKKLELCWPGKDHEVKPEPRVLIEDPEKSYGEANTENMLIHADNLLALKALEQKFAGKIKLIYIDPPFNTGSRINADGKEIGYDDGLEHSIWLNMMTNRLKILYKLLHKSGTIFIHLDDNELDYNKIILDELFGRENFINRITIDARSPSAFSTVNPGVFKASEYILWYAKNKSYWEKRTIRIPTNRDTAYNKYIINKEDSIEKWIIKPLKQAFLEDLNKDRLNIIHNFLKEIYKKRKDFNKKLLKEYITSNFQLHILFNIKLVSDYLHNKLRQIDSLDEFCSKVYPYLLEKCSYNYSSKDIDEFVLTNASKVFRYTEISDSGAGRNIVELKNKSKNNPDKIYKLERENNLDDVYIVNGQQLSFYDKNVSFIEKKLTATKLLTNIWTDISWEGIAKEGSIKFKKGKKPEKLLQRVLELSTNKNDWVLDSFLGSGTTAAVAHKMGRKWIGIELGEHANTHCLPRLKRVCDGTDQSGISKAVSWKGGGGFKFYELAPSLLNKDKFGQWIINPQYNAQLLAASMARQEGFTYQPDEEIYWKQGFASENHFIYTTTNIITPEIVEQIASELKPDESLLICCKAFSEECNNISEQIEIKKIPDILLGKCEFGKEDYSSDTNIINMPVDENQPAFVPSYVEPNIKPKPAKIKKEDSKNEQLRLF